MAAQTPERKELKKQLAHEFQKAMQSGLDELGVARSKQWGLARKVVNLAEKTAAGKSDKSLKTAFKKIKKSEMETLAQMVEDARSTPMVIFVSNGRGQDNYTSFAPETPKTLSIPSGPDRFRY